MKQLRVLLVGAAFSSDLHADGYSRILDKVQIVGICDKDLNRVTALAERYGFTGYTPYDDYVTAIAQCECDLVDICMPNFLHHDVAIQALHAGRDIICEKPLATTVEDAQDMVDTAVRLGRHIYYAEDWLFAPAFRRALEILDSGKVGRPLYIRARECHSGSHSPFAQSIQYCGGGCMVHLGVHPVSFMLALKNNRWSQLTAMTSGRQLVGRPQEDPARSSITVATALINFVNGVGTLGDVCNRIDAIEPGYVAAASLSGPIVLTPVWRVTTDTGAYQLDTVTGGVTRVS